MPSILHAHAAVTQLSLLPLAAMWLAMMAAMMAPAAWPWVVAFRRFDRPRGSGRAVPQTASFVGGYLAAWSIYATAAAALQLALARSGWLDPSAALTPVASGAVLCAAGLFQFAPLKRACLRHCRNPLSYFLARWRNAPASAVRIGFGHGLYCVGCCWALMTTAIAVGIMNVWWMAALATVVFAEQVSPRGEQLRVLAGLALVIAGAAQVAVVSFPS